MEVQWEVVGQRLLEKMVHPLMPGIRLYQASHIDCFSASRREGEQEAGVQLNACLWLRCKMIYKSHARRYDKIEYMSLHSLCVIIVN